MLFVVAYDIADDQRRMRVASELEDFGTWVQYSVFEWSSYGGTGA
jgi:CRISPR-associated endonuclease Cas2